MPERPLILFADPQPADKAKRHGGNRDYFTPAHEQQIARLQPKFSALQNALENGRLSFSQSQEGIEPEYTLVLEVAGDPRDFDIAIRHLDSETEGLEWLFELVNDDVPNNEDFYRVKKKTGERDDTKTMSYKYFCVLTNQRALTEILSLWRNYRDNPAYKFPIGKTGLKNVFDTLNDIHIWGVSERLVESGILEAWIEDLRDPNLPFVKCEIELFYRRSAANRTNGQQKVETEIASIGGQVIAKSCIEAIGYHALLASIPRQYAERIISNEEVELVVSEQIMFFKPTGQAIVTGSEESFDYREHIEEINIIDEPVVALFDGLPQERHPLLNGLLTIDDPDDYASQYQIADRMHGTSMASLITRGDLQSNSSTVTRRLYVRPIMKPYPTSRGTTQEFIPDDMLIVDKIHESVRRLFEPEAGRVAPTVRIINLSIGVGNRLFYNMISPLAKLLDWLSFTYRVLFIVSAGNHAEAINLGISFDDFRLLSDREKDAEIIRILDRNSRNLRLLSPAESMNSLTVGALFKDESTCTPNPRQSIPCTDIMPSPISSIGRGINRSIKPDLVFSGGRNVLLQDMTVPNIAFWRNGAGNYPPGILSAKPVAIAGAGKTVGYTFGTSDAAALISHNAGACFEVLNDIFLEELGTTAPYTYTALLVKSMLTHGAKWNVSASLICDTLQIAGRGADQIHKWLGYGVPDITRVKECAKNRVTLIGYGELEKDSARLYSLPLPFDFHAQKMYRCLTVTLSSFTPIRPTTQKYRAAQVWFTVEDGGKRLVPNRIDADDKAVTRGTLQHERFCGDSAIIWDETDSLYIKVNCREDAGDFTQTIPYAMIVSFEIAPEYDIDVYQNVVNKIRLREPIAPT